jgi:hypothetical protein
MRVALAVSSSSTSLRKTACAVLFEQRSFSRREEKHSSNYAGEREEIGNQSPERFSCYRHIYIVLGIVLPPYAYGKERCNMFWPNQAPFNNCGCWNNSCGCCNNNSGCWNNSCGCCNNNFGCRNNCSVLPFVLSACSCSRCAYVRPRSCCCDGGNWGPWGGLFRSW